MSLVKLTERARAKVEEFRSGVADSERQAMWIEITGIQRDEWSYNLSLKPVDAADEDDHVQYDGDLAIVIPEGDVEALRGATVDWSDDLMRGGLTIDNPNTPSPSIGARPPADLSGPVPPR